MYKYVLYPLDVRKTGASVFKTFNNTLVMPEIGHYYRKRTTASNYVGDAVAAEFYVYNPQLAKATQVSIDKYVKEEYVEEESFRLALTVGAKQLNYKTVSLQEDLRHDLYNYSDLTSISECKLSLGANCTQQYTNYVILGTSFALGLTNGSTEFALALAAGEVVYYHLTDQDQEVVPTLVGFGLGASAGPLLKAAVSTYSAASNAIKLGKRQLAQYYIAYRIANSSLDLGALNRLYNQEPSSKAVEILLKETSNPTVVKILQETDGSYKAFVGKIGENGIEITQSTALGSEHGYDLTKSSEAEIEVLGRQIMEDVTQELIEEAARLLDIQALKNLVGQIPTGKKYLSSLSKQVFDAHGLTILKSNATRFQATLEDIMRNGDRLGDKTEKLIQQIMDLKGYEKIEAKYNGSNGFDGLFIPKGQTIENATEIFIMESKQFKQGVLAEFDDIAGTNYDPASGLRLNYPNDNTGLPVQMSDEWIEYVIMKLQGQPGTKDLGDKLFLRWQMNRENFLKFVNAVDKSNGNIFFLKLNAY